MNRPPSGHDPVLIIGAGPAGLAAAYELVRQNARPLVLEKGDKPGGIARTEVHRGYRFDIGGHRFFTKNDAVMKLWQTILDQGFMKVHRVSRIYYDGRFLDYPLNFFNALTRMGPTESLFILLSYLRAQIRPYPEEETFEQWVSNRFGRRLYKKFFAPYTAKLWGMPCHRIPADWARQRIKGLSLMAALSHALFGNQTAKSLIHEFYYPEKGPGMMWEAFCEKITENGGHVRYDTKVVGLNHRDRRITGIRCMEGDRTFEMPVGHLISSMPLDRLVGMLDGRTVPTGVLKAANTLSHRGLILVVLILDKDALFPDQWIYIHSPGFKVGRIQNFKNWSPAMVPDPRKTSLGMEYFCSEGDGLSTMSDEALSAVAVSELARLGLAEMTRVKDTFVVRQPDAYPVYNSGYQKRLKVIRDFLDGFENLQTVGRNGMHRYNNMDHSMRTGILAAQNVLGKDHDLWAVNEEAEYLEEHPSVPPRRALTEKVILQSFARLDKWALGISLGTVSGLLFFVATLWLVIKGGEVVGPNLKLLSQYFFGYTVSVKGAFVAFFYGFLWGFLFGWLSAYLRNLLVVLYLFRVRKKAERMSLRDFLDHI
jgi:protoporphyrinogen oxidase